MDELSRSDSPRRARRALGILVLVAVLACGSLSAALTSAPGRFVGLRVAISGLALVAAIALAARVTSALDRARRPAPGPPGPPSEAPSAHG